MLAKYPFKITNLSRGAQKARSRMMKQYGSEEGERIWLDQAREKGEGTTDRQKINSVYKRGGHK